MNLSQIYEGWRNDLFPPKKLKELIKATFEERIAICNSCPKHSDNAKKEGYKTLRLDAHCVECGCPLRTKTKCLHCECPLKKWLAVLTEDQVYEIEQKLKN